MKTIATLTSKGQITIPLRIRKELGLQEGDSLEFECSGGRAELRPVRPQRRAAGVLKGLLPKNWRPPTVAEMDTAIARNLARKHLS